ncbi:aldo/keto reductase [Nostoc sp. TCL240-02]|uniref:aldo/keto reductase n=1 Tax=Nostoc sp. TCL240-02 TaxID=2572090 RepID=UPI00157FAFE0|nr:aldo/keto reductase [Nostoc sp. TCL240-02]QKQ74421.1 aldo/keto reductase [Nostoc sp. TCL240-02]
MQTKQLGNSELHITPIGFGAWAIGGSGWAFGWGAQEDQESIEAIDRALDLGVNWIDTAAIYGLGHSEEVVAKALKGRTSRPYIFTKCSMIWDEKGEIGRSLKADSVRREVEASLRRLDIETIDLYQIHWPNPAPEIEEGWTTLAKLKDEGKVRYIGVSNFNVEQLKRIQETAPVTSLQPPYSLVKRDVENEILPFCKENNIGVIVYSPMQSGLLTGKMTSERVANLPDDDWRKQSTEFQEPRLSRNLKLVEVLQDIGDQHDRSAGEVAIAWTLNNPAVTAAIVGARNPKQVEGIIAAGEFRLNQQELDQIAAFLRENP